MESEVQSSNQQAEATGQNENPKIMSLTDEYLQNMVKFTEGQLKRKKISHNKLHDN